MSGCKALLAFCLVITLSCVFGYNIYAIDRDVVGYLHRAQVAAQSEETLQYVQKTIKALEDRGMDRGNTAFIFGTPTSDMILVVNALRGLEERLIELNAMNKSSVEYQTGMDDVRGIARELTGTGESGGPAHINAFNLAWRFKGGAFLFVISIIFFGIAIVYYLKSLRE